MINRYKLIDFLSLLAGICILISSFAGLISSKGVDPVQVKNIYGDTIELYGKGLYAYNSILSVANRLGADMIDIVGGFLLILFTLRKQNESESQFTCHKQDETASHFTCPESKKIISEFLQSAQLLCLTYAFAFLVFGISLNSLYLVYLLGFSASLYATFLSVWNIIKKPFLLKELQKINVWGSAVFLMASGIFIAVLWLSMLIPAILNHNYSSLVGIQTTEPTFTFDLCFTCPILILCGLWLHKRNDTGYKTAPLLFYLLLYVGFMVIFQSLSAVSMGIEISLIQLTSMVISFMILGIVSFFYLRKFLNGIASCTKA